MLIGPSVSMDTLWTDPDRRDAPEVRRSARRSVARPGGRGVAATGVTASRRRSVRCGSASALAGCAGGLLVPSPEVSPVDVLECAKCGGRLRVIAVITERDVARRILAHLDQPTEAPLVARARDPTDDLDEVEPPAQLGLGLA